MGSFYGIQVLVLYIQHGTLLGVGVIFFKKWGLPYRILLRPVSQADSAGKVNRLCMSQFFGDSLCDAGVS